jgi:hypothetical protein
MKRSIGRTAVAASGSEEPLQVTVPQVTKRDLKIKSAERGEPMRVIVLKALAAAGIQVPQAELQDRRKEGERG